MNAAIAQAIRENIVATWLNGDARGFDDDTDLQESAILDSFATLALVAYLEETFHVPIDPADVSTESFRTVRTIAALVAQKMPTKASGQER